MTPPRLRGLVDRYERAVFLFARAKHPETKAMRKGEMIKAKIELLRAIAIIAGSEAKQ